MSTWHRHPSPIGELLLTAQDGSLTGLYTAEHTRAAAAPKGEHDPATFTDLCTQLDDYFAGKLRAFEATIRPMGTPFQSQVWDYLMTIPYGHTRTYSDIAKFIGSPDSVRAVGAANGANPISIIVPCHRVIAKGGALQGYAGGLCTKQWLLEHEARHAGVALMLG